MCMNTYVRVCVCACAIMLPLLSSRSRAFRFVDSLGVLDCIIMFGRRSRRSEDKEEDVSDVQIEWTEA